MKIKKEYTYSNKRQIWRLLPTDTGKIIIEERDTDKKEVFFNCIEISSGRRIIKNLQFEEKFWVGIEAVYKDIIYFHTFTKPDMPGHKGVFAYDISSDKILWKTDDYIYLFVHKNLVYAYKETFEGRKFFTLNYKSGKLINEYGADASIVNEARQETYDVNYYEDYLFPEQFGVKPLQIPSAEKIIESFKLDNVVKGPVEFIIYDDLLLFNCYIVSDEGKLKNIFMAIDILTEKIKFKERLNENAKAAVPDSFFIKDHSIFLLKDKTKLVVCSLRK